MRQEVQRSAEKSFLFPPVIPYRASNIILRIILLCQYYFRFDKKWLLKLSAATGVKLFRSKKS
jgi:hypothetical protein